MIDLAERPTPEMKDQALKYEAELNAASPRARHYRQPWQIVERLEAMRAPDQTDGISISLVGDGVRMIAEANYFGRTPVVGIQVRHNDSTLFLELEALRLAEAFKQLFHGHSESTGLPSLSYLPLLHFESPKNIPYRQVPRRVRELGISGATLLCFDEGNWRYLQAVKGQIIHNYPIGFFLGQDGGKDIIH